MLRSALLAFTLFVGSTASAQSCFPPSSSTPFGQPCAGWTLSTSVIGCNLVVQTTGSSPFVFTSLLVLGLNQGHFPLFPPLFLNNCFLEHDPIVFLDYSTPVSSFPLPTTAIPRGSTLYATGMLMHLIPASLPMWSTTNAVQLIW
jgi:hypothetical protein